jgi:large subunit ribosomal protein L22
MDVVAISRFVRLSPNKARDLARKVSGLKVADALRITELSPRKAAFAIGKTLKSAIANAENNAKLSVDDLTVKRAVIEEGSRWRRFWARSRGSVSPVQKRTCHVRIVLSDGKKESAPAE